MKPYEVVYLINKGTECRGFIHAGVVPRDEIPEFAEKLIARGYREIPRDESFDNVYLAKGYTKEDLEKYEKRFSGTIEEKIVLKNGKERETKYVKIEIAICPCFRKNQGRIQDAFIPRCI